jgi:hypothetical protein
MESRNATTIRTFLRIRSLRLKREGGLTWIKRGTKGIPYSQFILGKLGKVQGFGLTISAKVGMLLWRAFACCLRRNLLLSQLQAKCHKVPHNSSRTSRLGSSIPISAVSEDFSQRRVNRLGFCILDTDNSQVLHIKEAPILNDTTYVL